MSHVPKAEGLHIYQGEDWTLTAAFYDDDAPSEAEFANWEAYMEIRTAKSTAVLLVRCTTDEDDGYITRELDEDGKPTFRVRIPKAITRTLPVGKHETDFFAVPDTGDTFCVFYGDVAVTKRRTIEEGD
jgi:hypothetical protein